jgi:hypothetical protein
MFLRGPARNDLRHETPAGQEQLLPARPSAAIHGAIGAMKYLTKEQQKVLGVILLLLLTGLAVKTWRIAHPPRDTTAAISK